ncbi:hypothetical protein PL373_19120 [Tenacibaculum maritimum]|nr:hypothetical protein [Tenacibaculum maritimum]MDB0603201.1 hypothetical protein [Tenacibaculum maritimum]MDB0610463.1 hypothetical protein [Tenacibaculum maritimum]
MAKVNLNTIKNWFKTGLKPTQEQFFSTWDSFWHKDDAIPATSIENFDTYLAEKADKEALTNHIGSDTAHNTLFEEKVDKVDGKALSTNDYTNDEKQKLANLNPLGFGEVKDDKGNSIAATGQGDLLTFEGVTIDEINKIIKVENAGVDWLKLDETKPTSINDTIYTNGNVGIGTNAPTEVIDVNGTGRFRNVPNIQTPNFSLGLDSMGKMYKSTPLTNTVSYKTFKSSGSGYYCIRIPYSGTNFYMKFYNYRHGNGLETYEVAAYLNNPNGWIQAYVKKTGMNPSGTLETVTLTNSSNATDFRIYLGNSGTTWRGLNKLFISDAMTTGISGSNIDVTNLDDFTVTVESSIEGTIKGTF